MACIIEVCLKKISSSMQIEKFIQVQMCWDGTGQGLRSLRKT